MGDFGERMDVLSRQVGEGFCVGKVIVDQVYAKYQHEDLSLKHPRGGQAKYLITPLMLNRFAYLTAVARTCLDDGGIRGMAIAMEHLAGGISHSTTAIRGQGGGGLGALSRLPAGAGFPTVGESGPAGSWGVAHYAPILFGHLRESGHPLVYAPSSTMMGDGVPRYDRPPVSHRLSKAELEIEGDTIPYPDRLIGWIWWHILGHRTPPPGSGRH
ncbi:MAG TPA: hypothetical protein VGR71_05090 [Nitrospira sp.]|nr:hypothetical protein [Nitrospira sp.]